MVGDLIRLPLVGKVNVWLYKLPPECLKLSDLNVGFSLEGIDFDLGDIEVDFWEGLKEMGKGFAESLYFEKDPEDEKKVILRTEGQKVAAITLESKEKAEELVNISQQTHKASFPVNGGQLKEIFPNTPQARCDEVAALLNKYSDKFGINTPLRMAHFLGQIGTETTGLVKLKENYCYSSKSRIKEVFGIVKYCDLFEGYTSDLSQCNGSKPMHCSPNLTSISPSLLVKDRYVCSTDLFDYVYSCRYGNRSASSKDGSTYAGVGFIHLTFRGEFETISGLWNGDSDNAGNLKYFHLHPSEGGGSNELTEDLDVAMKASLYYWESKKLNEKANGMGNSAIDAVGCVVNGSCPEPPNSYKESRETAKKAYSILK